jgi:hypothetical protein
MAPNALPAGYTHQENRIEHVLGVGGFGLTYLAVDCNLNLKVAVKEYLPVDVAQRGADQTIGPRSPSTAETFGWGKQRARDARLRGERHRVHGDGVRRGRGAR